MNEDPRVILKREYDKQFDSLCDIIDQFDNDFPQFRADIEVLEEDLVALLDRIYTIRSEGIEAFMIGIQKNIPFGLLKKNALESKAAFTKLDDEIKLKISNALIKFKQ